MKKIEINVGDEFPVDFMKNHNGGKPVCRIEGIVCFIDRNVKELITPTSSWIVAIEAIYPTFMTVKPLYKTRTAKDNAILMESELALLKATQEENKKPKHFKTTSKYLYKSFAELKQEGLVQ